jgi:MFS family permease
MTELYYNKTGLPGLARRHLRRLGFGLAADVWLVQAGVFANYVGWGSVMPFEVVYLHDARGFGLGVAGLVVGTVTGLAVVAAPLAGPLIDRAGARAVAGAGGVALAAGYGGLALARTPAEALAAAVAAGVGNGTLLPSQSALLASLVPPELRHRATAVSRVAANLGGALGGAVGGVIAAYGLRGFVALYLGNALTYGVYVAVLVAVVRDETRPEPLAGGYRVLLGDRSFVRLALTNVGVIAVGWGIFTWIVPAYARDELGVDPRRVGLLLTGNALAVVLAQIPVARLAEGRRRTVTMALGPLTFAGAALVVAAATFVDRGVAYAAVLAAAIAVGVGECFYTAGLMPLVADLAPPALRGRYMGATGLSWWLGLGVAPTLGALLLGISPSGAMAGAAGVSLAAAASLLALDRELPAHARLTPRPPVAPGVAASPRATR